MKQHTDIQRHIDSLSERSPPTETQNPIIGIYLMLNVVACFGNKWTLPVIIGHRKK